MKEKTIFLQDFRKDNGLSQMDIADFLGVSKGYISTVERGRSSLSKQNVKRIIDAGKEKQWNTKSLVPAYTRIIKIEEEIQNLHCSENFKIDADVLNRIKEGTISIPENIARNYIQAYPELRLNFDWIMEGKEEMTNQTDNDQILTILSEITKRLDRIEKALGSNNKK